MGGGGGIIGAISSLLGFSAKPAEPEINLPTAQAPAPPAPSRKVDTGAKVQLGSGTSIKDQRVSGRRRSTATSARSVIGSLGGGSGLRV